MDDKLFSQSPGEASFVAIGDSFTEGLNDAAPGGGYRGWADRLAGLLAAEYPGLRYANLAVRGRVLREIVADQVPLAATMAPGLVSLGGGGNDVLHLGADPDTLAELFDAAVARLQGAGSQVLIFSICDPATFPLLRLLRGRIAAYNMHLRAIADARGCYLVDLWSMRFLRSPSAWAPDRLHLNPQSHQRVALRCCEVLGVPVTDDWRAPLAADPDPPAPDLPPLALGLDPLAPGLRPPALGLYPVPVPADPVSRAVWLAARRGDARWAREYLAPWVHRRLRGRSLGDGLSGKRPQLEAVSPRLVR